MKEFVQPFKVKKKLNKNFMKALRLKLAKQNRNCTVNFIMRET